jgi:hypothetical protein
MDHNNLNAQEMETTRDSANERSVLWEEYHPSHRNVDFFLIRIYSDGSYERYTNTLLEVDDKGNPKYSKIDYMWLKEGIINAAAIKEIKVLLLDKLPILISENGIKNLGNKQNSLIKFYLDKDEYLCELPNKQYAPLKYEVFEAINEIVYNNLSQE